MLMFRNESYTRRQSYAYAAFLTITLSICSLLSIFTRAYRNCFGRTPVVNGLLLVTKFVMINVIYDEELNFELKVLINIFLIMMKV